MFGFNGKNNDLEEALKSLQERKKAEIESLESEKEDGLKRNPQEEENIKERFKEKYIKYVTDFEQLLCAPLLSQLGGSKSPAKISLLIKLFYFLSDIRVELGEKTNDLKYYNDAAIRLQYTKYLIESNKINIPILDDSKDKGDERVNDEIPTEYHIIERLIEIHDAIIMSHQWHVVTHRPQISPTELKWLIISEQFSYKGLIESLREEMHVIASQPMPLIEAEKYCNKISDQLKHYLGLLFRDAELAIGKSPCEYAVISLGSIALKQTTPYSDLEFAIVLDNTSDPSLYYSYFEHLSHYVHFKVIMLGETSIPISDYNLRLDYLIKPGIQFDLGGKTPLGRKDKKYTLIKTINDMIKYLETGHDQDKILPYILQCSSYVCGEEHIANKYITAVNEFLTENGADRAYERLELGSEVFGMKGHLEALTLHSAEDSGKFIYVKNDVYRMADRFIYNLALIHGVDVGRGAWRMIDELEYRNIVLPSAGNNLKKALSFATILRIKIYDFYKCQSDKMDIRAVEQNDPKTSDIFHLTHELSEKLFEYYYIVFPLQDRLREFTAKYTTHKNNEGCFLNYSTITSETFYQHDPYTEGKVFLRLLNYYRARESLLKMRDIANILDNNYKTIIIDEFKGNKVDSYQASISALSALNSIGSYYHDLGLIHYYLRRFDDAKILFEESKIRKKEVYDQIIENPKDASKAIIPTYVVENILQSIILTLNHIGLTHIALKEYGYAFCAFYSAYDLKRSIIEALDNIDDAENHKDFHKIYNYDISTLTNLGTLYRIMAQKEYGDTKTTYLNKASYCFDIAQIITPDLSPLDNAYHLIGLGMISYVKSKASGGRNFKAFVNIFTRNNESLDISEMKNSLEKNQEALQILRNVYAYHPMIANVLKNISAIHYQLGSYKKSLNAQKESLVELNSMYSDDHYQVKNSLKRLKTIKKNTPHHKNFNEFAYFINKLQNLGSCFFMTTEKKIDLIVKMTKVLELSFLPSKTLDDWIITPLNEAINELHSEVKIDSDRKREYSETKQEKPLNAILNHYSKIYDMYINLFYAVNLLYALEKQSTGANNTDLYTLYKINETILEQINEYLVAVNKTFVKTAEEDPQRARFIEQVTNIISKAHVINEYISKLNIYSSEINIHTNLTNTLAIIYSAYDITQKEQSVIVTKKHEETTQENNSLVIKKDSIPEMITAHNIKRTLDAIATLHDITEDINHQLQIEDNKSDKNDDDKDYNNKITIRTPQKVMITSNDLEKKAFTAPKKLFENIDTEKREEKDTKPDEYITLKLQKSFKDAVDKILEHDNDRFASIPKKSYFYSKDKSIDDVLNRKSSWTDSFFSDTESPILGNSCDIDVCNTL